MTPGELSALEAKLTRAAAGFDAVLGPFNDGHLDLRTALAVLHAQDELLVHVREHRVRQAVDHERFDIEKFLRIFNIFDIQPLDAEVEMLEKVGQTLDVVNWDAPDQFVLNVLQVVLRAVLLQREKMSETPVVDKWKGPDPRSPDVEIIQKNKSNYTRLLRKVEQMPAAKLGLTAGRVDPPADERMTRKTGYEASSGLPKNVDAQLHALQSEQVVNAFSAVKAKKNLVSRARNFVTDPFGKRKDADAVNQDELFQMCSTVLSDLDTEGKILAKKTKETQERLLGCMTHMDHSVTHGEMALERVFEQHADLKAKSRASEKLVIEVENEIPTIREMEAQLRAEHRDVMKRLDEKKAELRARIAHNHKQYDYNKNAIADFMARLMQKKARIDELRHQMHRNQDVKARIAELERDNEEMEAAVQALLTFLPENLGRSVKDIEALRQTGIGVELGVELFLLQNERFKEDAQFQTQELLPFEKVLRKAVPLRKALYPFPSAPPGEAPAEMKA